MRAPLLPGHGETPDRLQNATFSEWTDAMQAELDGRARLSFAAGARVVPSTLADAPLLGAACVGWRGKDRSR